MCWWQCMHHSGNGETTGEPCGRLPTSTSISFATLVLHAMRRCWAITIATVQFPNSMNSNGPHDDSGEAKMKWITREYVKVDRVACPWLIKKFVDKDAEFIFVPTDKVMEEASRLDAIPYDVKNVELGHHGKECSFEAILKKYKLRNDPALVLLAKIVNAADTDNTLYRQPEGPGLEAIAEGFRHLGFKNDHEVNAAEWIVLRCALCVLQRDGEGRKTGRRLQMISTRQGSNR